MAIGASAPRHDTHFVRRGLRRPRRVEGNDDTREGRELRHGGAGPVQKSLGPQSAGNRFNVYGLNLLLIRKHGHVLGNIV